MIKKFIAWYLEKKAHCCFRYKNKVVRMFSETYYETKMESLITALDLLEECAEEIENLYGRETELTERVRDFIEK